MKREDIRKTILEVIDAIAPGSRSGEFDADADMREEMDLDSMDILNLVAALHDRIGVVIPESDLDQITTLNAAIGYIERCLSKQ